MRILRRHSLRCTRGTLSVLVAAILSSTTIAIVATQGRPADERRRQRFAHAGVVDEEDGGAGERRPAPTEAPAGFDNQTNGFDEQGPPFEDIDEDSVVPLRSFNDNRFIFEEVETVADGLGPTYNAQSCRECHQNVVTGGASQVAEHRTGRRSKASSSSRSAGRWFIRGQLIPTSVRWSRSKMTSGRSESRPTRWGPDSSKPSPTNTLESAISNPRSCAVWP